MNADTAVGIRSARAATIQTLLCCGRGSSEVCSLPTSKHSNLYLEGKALQLKEVRKKYTSVHLRHFHTLGLPGVDEQQEYSDAGSITH